MKNLILVRHAKSSWGDPSLPDRDRPLNERGRHDAPRMGAFLRQKGVAPDLILSSTAKRAFTTAKHFAKALDYPPASIVKTDLLYVFEFDIDAILGALETFAENGQEQVMVFGHNPTFTYAANRFGFGELDNLPTCGVASIRFFTNDWRNISESEFEGEFCLYPKMLPKR